MDLLLINNENKSHHVYIKDFNKFMFSKTKHIVYNVLVVKSFSRT